MSRKLTWGEWIAPALEAGIQLRSWAKGHHLRHDDFLPYADSITATSFTLGELKPNGFRFITSLLKENFCNGSINHNYQIRPFQNVCSQVSSLRRYAGSILIDIGHCIIN